MGRAHPVTAFASLPGGSAVCLALLLPSGGCGWREPGPRELSVALAYQVRSLDPHREDTFEALETVSNVYEPLVALDRRLGLVPALAVSWHNPDATTWSFRLRPGVRFHDGSLLSAADVAYSIRRLREDPDLELRTNLAEVTDVSVEAGEVVLRTGRPSAYLLNDLAHVLVVRAGSSRHSLDAQPNGTGPYAVESWTPRLLRLRRHESYWGARPAFPVVRLTLGVSESETTAGLLDGRFSVARTAEPKALRAPSDAGRLRLVTHPSVYLRYLGFDVSSPALPGGGAPNPFRRLEVRQAIDLGLDRKRIAASWSPYAVPADGIVPRAVFGSHERAPRLRDLEKARRLLGAAGYPRGFDAVLHSGYAAGYPPHDELRAQLAEIGIRLTVVAGEDGTDLVGVLQRGEAAFWLRAQGCPTGEAGSLLAASFHSPDPARRLGSENFSRYADADLDRSIDEANATLDPAERLPALQHAVRTIEDRLLWIPLFHNAVVFVVDPALAFEPRDDLQLRYAEMGTMLPRR
jgi:peptide/nickel transport system substrate-binding protein